METAKAHRNVSRRAALAMPFLLGGAGAGAQVLPPPGGRVVLDVAGSFRASGATSPARFDLAMLDGLPQQGFSTRTPWFDGPRHFRGVAGAALMSLLDPAGAEVRATALNDYRVTIPAEDFRSAGLVIATRLDDQPIPVREKGPLWIVYPFDSDARLRNEVFYGRSIWQLRRLAFPG